MRRTARPLALSLTLLAGPAGSAGLPAVPGPLPHPATAPATGLPPGVHPLAPKLARRMDKLVQAAERARGLKLKHPVPYGALDEKGLKAKVAETLAEDLPPEQMRALEVSLRAFGLLPEGESAGKVYRDLLGQQVAAFYDPEKKYLAMVERQGKSGGEAELDKTFGADLARRAQEGIVVHELTHAIDDQSFDLGRMAKSDPLSDGAAAFLGLVEGDATLTMFDFVLGKRVAEVPGFGLSVSEMMKDPGQLAAMSPDLPGSAGLADAPVWFRDTLLFSYLQGFAFCLHLERRGGSKLLDYAFAKDPPRSTEQILHPEKWLDRRDDPIELAWPDLTAALPGWKKAAEGQMGEEGMLILLRQAEKRPEVAVASATPAAPAPPAPPAPPAALVTPAAAAAGWGGDRFAVYEKAGQRLLLWLTEWDGESDAAEFQTAAARLGEDWQVVRSAPTRVVLSRGPKGALAPEPLAAAEAALAAVQAVRPANKNIDLKELGIAPTAPIAPGAASAN